MHTQTVQNSPLLTGSTASSRPSNAAQDDQQFAQALNHQIERQALPPAPQPQVNAAPRRADAPKPAAPAPQAAAPAPASQQPKPSSNAAPANNANAPAKAGQDQQADNSAQAGDAQAAPANAGAADNSATGTRSAASGKSADDAGQTDEQKTAGDAAADMLAMLQGLAQPVATDGAAAAAAATATASASAKAGRSADAAALAGDAVLDGKGGKSRADVALNAADTAVDQANLLAAKATAGAAASGKAGATEQDPALADALSRLQGHAGADAAGTDKAQPRTDFQAALQQASADAGKAASAAELDARHAIAPQAGALQAAATALAPAGAANAQAAQALAGNALHARVGSQGWDQQLGQKVVWMVNGGEQSATLTLNPPDLGPLQVVLSVSNDQASVAFTAAQPEVRAALEQALPKLRETMGDAGIMLGDASVSSGSQDQQQAFAGMASGSRGRGAANGQNGNSNEGDAAARPAPQVRRSVLSAVDTFA